MNYCERCKRNDHGNKVFPLIPNPSVSFVILKPNEFPTHGPVVEFACVECLTEEELYKIVLPVVLFAVNHVIKRGVAQPLLCGLANLQAEALYHIGEFIPYPHEVVRKLLK